MLRIHLAPLISERGEETQFTMSQKTQCGRSCFKLNQPLQIYLKCFFLNYEIVQIYKKAEILL